MNPLAVHHAPLPIEPVLPALRDALAARGVAVLQAPPGAGKTTRVPLALLGERWLGARKIVMLEPRRLAARAAARYMADTLGERVGETVGHRVRMDTRVGPRTRVEVVTEGVLTRMLQHDAALEDVGLVIFDEFHERSLHADLGLALSLQTRELLRDDLRILVMSATLDGAAVGELLGGAPVVTSEGRGWPVAVRHVAPRAGARLEAAVASAVGRALDEEDGDILVFLPGAGEIRRVQALLAERAPPPGTRIAPLFGDLPHEEQELAIRPSEAGRRKVVLATAIAETSLTIEGVRVVIDAGLMRVPRFDVRTGMMRLETVRVTRASAEQRRGRAGRVAPGVCWRLWPEQEMHHLVAHGRPDILEADLAPLALELAAAGVRRPDELRWLDVPPAAAYERARELLAQLGALDEEGRLTTHGRRMAALGLHPRLAHMSLVAATPGERATAAALAALLEERDPLRGAGAPPDADVRLRLELLRGEERVPSEVHGATVDRDAVRRLRAAARHWRQRLGAGDAPLDADAAGRLVAAAYPDRVAQRRGSAGRSGGARWLLRSGSGAFLEGAQPLGAEEYLAVAELDGRRPESRILLAAPLAPDELETLAAGNAVREEIVEWDDAAEQVTAVRRERFGALVLREAAIPDADPERALELLLAAIARRGLGVLGWTRGAAQLRDRLRFLHHLDPSWPDVSDAALLDSLGVWLGPRLHGVRRLDEVRRADPGEALLATLPWDRRAALDELAPTHITVPSGSRIPIDYSDPDAPALAVRLQEMFGLAETPRIGGSGVPLTLHLLSPAHRPVQVTRDLAGFWRSSYFDVRRDLRGRYPKHHWPEDPMAAEATSRAKRK